MKLLSEASCQNYDQTQSGNFQDIKETLLRLAVKYCENYATDVLILLKNIDQKNKTDLNSDYIINIGFRQFGIDWQPLPSSNYRYKVQLGNNKGEFKLYGELGNV